MWVPDAAGAEETAVENAIVCKFRNMGQTCVCANRIYVQDGVYDAFAEKLAAASAGLKVGNGTQAGVAIGPLINKATFDKVQRLLSDAIGKGAKALVGGGAHELGGNFVQPTVLTDVTTDMEIARLDGGRSFLLLVLHVLLRLIETQESELVGIITNTAIT